FSFLTTPPPPPSPLFPYTTLFRSPRHFARAFAAETGMTPAKAIERLRLEAARERVESGAEPIEGVAAHTGFGDPERMRRAFIRADRKSTRLNSSHVAISYAVFCLK